MLFPASVKRKSTLERNNPNRYVPQRESPRPRQRRGDCYEPRQRLMRRAADSLTVERLALTGKPPFDSGPRYPSTLRAPLNSERGPNFTNQSVQLSRGPNKTSLTRELYSTARYKRRQMLRERLQLAPGSLAAASAAF